MQRRIISKEIKTEIVAKVKSGEKVAELAKQYGVSDKSIYGWIHQDSGEEIVSVAKYSKLMRENAELKRLIGELTLETSWKKKS